MVSTVYLDITTCKVQRSSIELHLSNGDILELYNEAFGYSCPICHAEVDPPGVLCCECFSNEMRHHADCCLAEEKK